MEEPKVAKSNQKCPFVFLPCETPCFFFPHCPFFWCRGNAANSVDARLFFSTNSQLMLEMRNALCVAAVALSYVLLLVPYAARVKVDQIARGYNYSYYNLLMEPHLVASSSSSSSSSGNSTEEGESLRQEGPSKWDVLEVGVPSSEFRVLGMPLASKIVIFQVEEDHLGVVDLVLVWMRYLHFVLVPVIVFAIHKVRLKHVILPKKKSFGG